MRKYRYDAGFRLKNKFASVENKKRQENIGSMKKKGKTAPTGANRTYKDSVFRRLFAEKDKLAEVYNAIAGTHYTADDIEIVTLENLIFVGRENDIAFIVDGRLIVLIEHQSTINPNMPLRCLLYIAREYDILAKNEAIYSANLVKIMPPEFIVMYNGVDEYPEEAELRLSDAFVEKTDSLELRVKVYNANEGHNAKIMSKSVTLSGYAAFVDSVRTNRDSGFDLRDALEKAVRDCVKANVLKEFLEKYGNEVVNMMSTEFNLEDAKKVWYNDGKEEGKEEVAERMLKRGRPLEIIAEDTGLPVARINEMAKKMGNMRQ